MFRDGFEDGVFAWNNTGGSSVDVTNSTLRADPSLHQVSGPGDDHLMGVFHHFGDVQARYRVYIRPGSAGRNQCYSSSPTRPAPR
jgi:hypothetical protein